MNGQPRGLSPTINVLCCIIRSSFSKPTCYDVFLNRIPLEISGVLYYELQFSILEDNLKTCDMTFIIGNGTFTCPQISYSTNVE